MILNGITPDDGMADLAAIRERLLRPAIGFNRPADVLKDPLLPDDEKRQILASWASDACAVAGKPHLRWMPGSSGPVPVAEVQEALARAERRNSSAGGKHTTH